ncbi:hypothetical protein [Methylobacterium nigriterrae]|uniref:hypothetical protein n=1 Tax=Methylobacterium nigriterrae TaxID=3127512 RepID=UPI0030139B10
MILNTRNEVIRVESLMAAGDDMAKDIARAMAEDHAVELWQGVQRIERIEPPRITGN